MGAYVVVVVVVVTTLQRSQRSEKGSGRKEVCTYLVVCTEGANCKKGR